MAAVKKTEGGFEITHRFLGIAALGIALIGSLGGVAVASVRAADKIESSASHSELVDSIGAIRAGERIRAHDDSIHEARQDSTTSWYSRQTLGLLCKQYGNPDAFCSDRGIAAQAGRPR
jgi:hypothetical protein